MTWSWYDGRTLPEARRRWPRVRVELLRRHPPPIDRVGRDLNRSLTTHAEGPAQAAQQQGFNREGTIRPERSRGGRSRTPLRRPRARPSDRRPPRPGSSRTFPCGGTRNQARSSGIHRRCHSPASQRGARGRPSAGSRCNSRALGTAPPRCGPSPPSSPFRRASRPDLARDLSIASRRARLRTTTQRRYRSPWPLASRGGSADK